MSKPEAESRAADDDTHGVEYELFQVPAILLITLVSAIGDPCRVLSILNVSVSQISDISIAVIFVLVEVEILKPPFLLAIVNIVKPEQVTVM